MKFALLKWIIISALLHIVLIVSSSVVPLLVSLTTGSPTISNVEVSLTEDVAQWDDDEDNNKDNVAPVIDMNSLNIDVVNVSRIEDLFSPDISSELLELIRIYTSEKLSIEEANRNSSNEEVNKAKTGLNVINTYPLGVHADVILENLDFTKAFDASLSFRVNSDGSFRALEILESSGFNLVDESLLNIFKELSVQKIAFFTNFRRIHILIDSDGEDLVFRASSYLKDSLQASSIHMLLNSVLNSSKNNNKNDEETMTILNNLRIERDNNAIIIIINVKSLFVKDAIKD